VHLSVSNIAWPSEYDQGIYSFLSANRIKWLEIAPTRIFPYPPYDDLVRAEAFARRLYEIHGIAISSIQSIWFGVAESIFGSAADRQKLLDYTYRAIDFACALNCRNIVFGCPWNRSIPSGLPLGFCLPIAHRFFRQIGDYAAKNGTYIAIEPNPPIYKTNFINTTRDAFEFCRRLNNPGIKVNVDLGTIIYYNESTEMLTDCFDLINHIHISEPNLIPIQKRALHKDMIRKLRDMNYSKCLSIEMKDCQDIDLFIRAVLYAKEFCDAV
jgi:sugar phosphate isomerase/epimerase